MNTDAGVTRPEQVAAPRAVLAVLLSAAVFAIVLGIVGMHALNTHGVVGDTDHAMTSPMTAAHADMSEDASADSEGRSPADPVLEGGSGSGMGGVVVLCFAMLVATVGALLFQLSGVRRRPRVWAYRPTAPTSVTGWVTARLGTGPPPVWQFSVIRC